MKMKTDERPFLNQTPESSNHEQRLPDIKLSLFSPLEDSPIEQVRNAVPTTDDPTLPVITFRTWVIGPIINVFTSAMLQIFSYQRFPLAITKSISQIFILLLGKLMAAKLPNKVVKLPGINLHLSLNSGPFNIKEHVLVSILANTGYDSSQSIPIINVVKAFFHKDISFQGTFLLVQTNQMLGYGFAGILLNYLVNSPHMWFPFTVMDVAFYRALHDPEKRPKGGVSKLQFLLISCVSIFAFSIVSSFYVSSLVAFSIVCLIWKKSVLAQILGSGANGLGLGSFSLDWTSIVSYLGSPLAYPRFVLVNKLVGFIAIMYILTPLVYFNNWHSSKKLPIFGMNLFDSNGDVYKTPKVFGENLVLDPEAYTKYSSIRMPAFTVITTGLGFAGFTAMLTHFALFYGREAWLSLKQAINQDSGDIHNELMKKYETIPQRWFSTIVAIALSVAVLNSYVNGREFQLQVWGVVGASLITVLLLLPVGVIYATTGMSFGIGLIGDMIIGYTSPGKPISLLAFKAYSQSTKIHALGFLAEFKLGHYMKIPPKSMFLVQIIGGLLASTTRIITAWWALSSIKDICVQDVKNIWSCPADARGFNRALIWGGVGPSRVYAPHGQYAWLYIFFLVGIIGPAIVWVLSRAYPSKKWLKLIHFPIIFTGAGGMPPMGAGQTWSFLAVGLIFHFWVYAKYRSWWGRHVYDLSNGLDLGIALFSVVSVYSLTLNQILEVSWEGSGDQCPLATCPTASGPLLRRGCPPPH